MATIKEHIENLRTKLKELQCQFHIVEMGVADKLTKIEETINWLSEALLFDQAREANTNPMLVSFKSQSRSVEKESHDNFEGRKTTISFSIGKTGTFQILWG